MITLATARVLLVAAAVTVYYGTKILALQYRRKAWSMWRLIAGAVLIGLAIGAVWAVCNFRY